ncbi:MAG: YigZ family protein [Bermanella sp.]|tara:strand:- start:21108 stop:21692 length:585 start_codon:yes stop_codon:yes gene_type:complete
MHHVATNSVLYELTEKRSRFITYCEKVESQDAFKRFLRRLKTQYPDARHFCYGFRIGPLSSAQRGFSDDGEPSGTAGMPILNVIDHSLFSDIAIIVVRYFGGTKLGTGGLARAYSEAAKQSLERIEWEEYEAKQVQHLVCDFHQEHQLRYLLNQVDGHIIKVEYAEKVLLKVELSETADLSTFAMFLVKRENRL